MIGKFLGSYQVLSKLGAGGMGEVYLAKDTRLGRDVAIKALPTDVSTDRDRLTRFEREAKAVSALNHPHIVTLYEVGTSDSGPFIVMERIDGRSIRELLDDGPMPIRRLLTIGTQIAEGLAKAHAAGIVHRDLKPGNIMVTSDGFAKILDFGLAKLVHPELDANAIDAATTMAKHTESGLVLGTVGYLSPEQAAGKPVDYRADQFALGALLYEMATRERPFKRATLVESLAATISDDVEPLRSKRPEVPAPLEWLIDRCLSKDPGDRYASTSDLARELASIRDHLSDLTRMPSGEMPDGRKRASRTWKPWAAVILGGVVVGAAGFAAAKLTSEATVPSFRPLTFQRGIITGARFGPDGKTIYYSMAEGSGPSHVFVTHLDRPESRLLDVPPGFLLGVSSKQELTILQTDGRAPYSSLGTLIRIPALGGTPRPLVERATFGDWAPDGEQLAVVREGGKCEFPIGQKIPVDCGMIRVSPNGDRVAITGNRLIQILDRTGGVIANDTMALIYGIAWAPDGNEVWFTASETGAAHDRALYALGLQGGRRLISRVAGAMSVYDVASDGKGALIVTGAGWLSVNASSIEGSTDQSLDLHGRSQIAGLSSDGKWVLLDEMREVGTGAYLRSTDGKEKIRFEGMTAYGLRPDGAWALVHPREDPARLQLVPRGAGEPRAVPITPGLQVAEGQRAIWSRDGRRLFAWLRPLGGDRASARIYMRENDGPWQALSEPGVPYVFAVSPSGDSVALGRRGDSVVLISTQQRSLRTIEGELGTPIHWSADGHELFLAERSDQIPARIYRRHLTTGRVAPWRTIAPADPLGVMFIGQALIADDEKSFVYQYGRGLNELFLVRDVK